MSQSCTKRSAIRARIEELTASANTHSPSAYDTALTIFLDLSLVLETIWDFKTLCVLIPDVCLHTPASLYLRSPGGKLALRRTTLKSAPPALTFPEPSCPPSRPLIRHNGVFALPICSVQADKETVGILCLHGHVDDRAEEFYQRYSERIAIILHQKQTALSNRQRLNFITSLVRDIGHNVIVPNMEFKLLFMHMDRQINQLAARIDTLAASRPDEQQRALRRELPSLTNDLRSRLRSISSRFQQSSLFLESLLRRSHFDKGNYDLMLRPCKFKSQIIEPQLERFSHLLRGQNVHVCIAPDVHIDEDIVLKADHGLIAQVLANLLANAVKYTGPDDTDDAQRKRMEYGWRHIRDAFGPGCPGVTFYVSTTGPHISEYDASRLFQPDFRGKEVTAHSGSGHGLFFVKQIVEQHKGRVAYERVANMNSFSFTLPYHQPDQPDDGSDVCRNAF